MAPGNVSQRMDSIEEGLEGMKLSISEMQQQFTSQLSLLTEKMETLVGPNRATNQRIEEEPVVRNPGGDTRGGGMNW